MYPAAITLSVATTAATTGLPFFHLGGLDLGPVPIQWFGMIVAAGVLIGASLLRRYAEWHGVSDDHIRALTGWITVSGFLGAHWFDSIFYEWDRLSADPLLFFKLWDGISSYGGFVGGAIGFALYVWWKRLDVRLFADISIVGLLPAFTIGRIGCTVVSDHIGAAVDASKWYAGMAMNYPVEHLPNGTIDRHNTLGPILDLVLKTPGLKDATHVLAWNLGLIEFLYLIPVNLIVLLLAFRPGKRMNAGFVVALSGVLYAPVRFGLDFLRPAQTDPRYFGLTFAQYCSMLAFGVGLAMVVRIMRNGKPAETVARSSKEAQQLLKLAVTGSGKDDPDGAKAAADTGAKLKEAVKKADQPKATAKDKKADAKADDAAKPAKAEDKKADAKADDAAKPAKADAKADDAAKPAKADAKADDAAKPAKTEDAKSGPHDVTTLKPTGDEKAETPSPDDVATIRPGERAKSPAK